MSILRRLKRWLFTPPPEGAHFFTNIRDAARLIRAAKK